ncbi:TlpA disulfide reductase family protein [Amycolatopsis carbonis]|uniref:TlpA disulfide reductase family protein n=1 Tax=Amycolatopsis carbonis TaxID=715471 RepID=A0A9Y2IFR3_9PSEU|nr:TlpA disulfide reductase family protein [Amycolatopsis sp. 2-15]WIX79237.1 TlpA disulfide reductase family protein [Amycolatopsis sp. 2-15]
MRTRRWPGVALAVAGLVTVAACSTGTDAVVEGGTFEFVSPGGQTKIFYDPPASRGTAPELAGEDLMQPGRQIGLSDFDGKVVVVNIWGSWCGPCRAEMPALQQVYDQTKDTGVQLLGIDVRDEPRTAPQDFIRDRAVTYPSIYDPPGRSLLALKGYPRNVVPSTIVLDRRHRVAAVFLTALLAGDLLPVVRRLSAEPTTPQGQPS